MKYPLHLIIRKKLSHILNATLALFRRQKHFQEHIDPKEIKNIIIIRPNYRIGNLIFLTPLINELEQKIPHAKIDIIVGMRLAGKILEPMPNVRSVIDIPRKLLLHPVEMFDYIKKTRKTNYDLALNISGGSTSAQIVTSLVKARYKATFDAHNLWAKFTHTQVRGLKTYNHMGLEVLEFLRFFDFPLPKEAPSLDIKLREEEITQAQKDLQALRKENGITQEQKIIAIFRNARFDKKIANEWWGEWLTALLQKNPNIVVVDILSPDIPEKLNDNVLAYGNKDLRILGAFFRACNLYVSADTGPMHLAVASGAKVLALFNKTNMEVYGALGANNKTIDIEKLTPQQVANITLERL